MPSNVRPFPIRKTQQADWKERLIAAIVYLAMGYVFRLPSDGHFNLFLILGLLYWALIHHRRIPASYFLRYHLLQSLIFSLFATMAALILFSLLNMLVAVVDLTPLLKGTPWLTSISLVYAPMAVMLMILGVNAIIGLGALLGKTWRIRWVADCANYWA